MREIDAAVGQLADRRGVRDHEDRVALGVKLAQEPQDDFLVGFVEIAGGLVRENQFRMIDQRARHGDALLFAAGKLRGQMRHAVGEADAGERLARLGFVRRAVKILREHHVFERGEIWDEMKLLEDEADFLGAKAREAGFVKPRDIDAIDERAAGGGRVEPAENIDQRGLARAGRAHDRDPFARIDAERHAVERAHVAEFFAQILDLDDGRHSIRLLQGVSA